MMFRIKLLLSITLIANSMAYSMDTRTPGMEEGPMNAEWFYNEGNPFYSANQLLQQGDWVGAEREYKRLLKDGVGMEYDQSMAELNLASAQMAQGKASKHWEAFAGLGGIASRWLLTAWQLRRLRAGEAGTVVVQTGKVGIGDIVHFLPVVRMLKKAGVSDVRLAVRECMHKPLAGPSEAYGVPLIKDGDASQTEGWQTHLMALYGLLKVKPCDLASDRGLYTTQESAMVRVREAIAPHEGKQKVVVFLGENRQAVVMGGKRLLRRHLDAAAFEQLLRQEGDVVLIDCNPASSRIQFGDEEDNLMMSSEFKDRVVGLPSEKDPFDSTIALGLICNRDEGFVGCAADNGPPNLFSRVLDRDAQRRFAFVLSDENEADMRMTRVDEGGDGPYTQMLSLCRVYRCDNPIEQAATIVGAYADMTAE